jgi:hypothetical protein
MGPMRDAALGIPTVKRIEFTDSGRISALDLITVLEPQFGYVVRLRFRPTPFFTPPSPRTRSCRGPT